MDPLVSVIIPAYNHEKYVINTLESVLNQSYSNLEVLLIDDCSIDNTWNTIMGYSRICDSRIKVIRNDINMGVSKTLNKSLDIISGKYCQFIASDDILDLKKIETNVKYMEKQCNCALVFSKLNFIDQDGNNVSGKWSYPKSDDINFLDILLCSYFIPAPTVFLRTSAIKMVRFPEDTNLEDWPTWVLLAKAYKVGYIPIKLVYYRIHSNNSSKKTGYMLKESLKAVEYLRVRGVFTNKLQYTIVVNNFLLRYSMSEPVLKNKIRLIKMIFLKLIGRATAPVTIRHFVWLLFKWNH